MQPKGLLFPVRNIFCIGRNYPEHAQEMGSAQPKPAQEDLIVFLKPTSSLAWDGAPILLPELSHQVHHEVEIVLALKRSPRHKLGAPIEPADAVFWIHAIAIGIDVTARDLQEKAKKQGLPWTLSKGFNSFAQVGKFKEIGKEPGQLPAEVLDTLEFGLSVNSEERQRGHSGQMIFNPGLLIHLLSKSFALDTGDLVFTGTPKGVGSLQNGDKVEAWLNPQVSEIKTRVKGKK